MKYKLLFNYIYSIVIAILLAYWSSTELAQGNSVAPVIGILIFALLLIPSTITVFKYRIANADIKKIKIEAEISAVIAVFLGSFSLIYLAISASNADPLRYMNGIGRAGKSANIELVTQKCKKSPWIENACAQIKNDITKLYFLLPSDDFNEKKGLRLVNDIRSNVFKITEHKETNFHIADFNYLLDQLPNFDHDRFPSAVLRLNFGLFTFMFAYFAAIRKIIIALNS